jgi:pimeloyl-ACP methyl ester carboxylesterase
MFLENPYLAHMAEIQFSHANGVPAQTYQPLFDLLVPHPVSFLPVMGQGRHQAGNDWQPLAQELIETIEATHTEPVVGLGHSLGGVVTCWAALQRPDLFAQVILLDPPFLSLKIRRWLIATHWLGAGVRQRLVPLAQKAARRRDHFSSYDEARSYWAGKRFFQTWDPACFEAYVQHSLTDDGQGGLTLRIPRSMEAHLFANTPHRLRGGPLAVPAHYLHAVPGGVTPPEVIAQGHHRAFPGMTFLPMAGSHMFPVEQPAQTAEVILRLIG